MQSSTMGRASGASLGSSGRAALVERQNHLTQEVELALRTFTNQIKPTFLTIVVAMIYLSTNVAGYSQGTHSKFEAALKKGLCCNFVVEPKFGEDDRKFSSSQ
jgi:hypothetical protein